MIFIQLILVVAFVTIFGYTLQRRNTAHLKASRKLLFFAFLVVTIVAVLQPDLLTKIAHAVGVGRGADLLLYITVVAFIFVTMNVYLKFKDYEYKIVQLTRRLALYEAKLEEADQKGGREPARPKR
jgi:hypothetical protein